MLYIVFVHPLIILSIWPIKLPISMHHILLIISLVSFTIQFCHNSITMNHSILKFSLICSPITPRDLTLTILQPIFEFPVIILMLIDKIVLLANSIGLVIFELSNILIIFSINIFSITFHSVINILSFVKGTS